MRMVDLIRKKRDGMKLSREELFYIARGCADDSIPDYQLSAFAMAVLFRGMDAEETADLTDAMARSGDTVDLSRFGDKTADKHSTGGVGDKTTMIVAPIVASLGGKVAKMSGRGLGHTGGTCDKLEAIPGYKTQLSPEAFMRQVGEIGLCVVGQSANLAPADKKLYALRDVTATVESMPLIASSVMSKKIAAGARNIVLDVKVGGGAFMKTREDALELAREMVAIGTACGRRVDALLTNMDVPLGRAVGNSLEVQEAVRVLRGETRGDIRTVASALAARLLCRCNDWDEETAAKRVDEALDSGAAFEKFRRWIAAQGGDLSVIDDLSRFKKARRAFDFTADRSGFVRHMDAEKIGLAASALGAGREKKDDDVDPAAGILLHKKTGEAVRTGEAILTLYTNREKSSVEALRLVGEAVEIGSEKPEETPCVLDVVKGGAARQARNSNQNIGVD